MTPRALAQADAPGEVELAAEPLLALAEAGVAVAPESAGLLAAGAAAADPSLLADPPAAPTSPPAGLSADLSPAAWSPAAPPSAPPSAPFFWPPSRKSVTYQPDPFS